MDQETQDNKNLNQKSEQMKSLKEIAERVFYESQTIIENKQQILGSVTIILEPGSQAIRMFGRVNSKDELEKQTKFFLQSTCLMIKHTVQQIQRLIENNIFEDQVILQFLKTISFSYENQDSWQLQYLSEFQKILDQKVDVKTNLSKKTLETFIKLWIKAREFSAEIEQQLYNSIIEQQYPNLKSELQSINSAIYQRSKDQINNDKKKQKYEDCGKVQQKKNMTPTDPFMGYSCKIVRVKQKQQIHLIPDGKIFSGVISKENHLSLSRTTEFREINKQFFFQQKQSFVQIHYKGELSLNLIPHGQGELVAKHKDLRINYKGGFKDGCFNGDGAEYRQGKLDYQGQYYYNYKNGEGIIPISENQYIKGIFLCDRKNGIFEAVQINKDQQSATKQKKYYFHFNKQLDVNSPQDNLIIQQFIQQQKKKYVSEIPNQMLSIGHILLSNFSINSLKPGKWFTSQIIDAFILTQYNFELLKRNRKIENPYLILNVANCQDIFSSVITSLNKLNYKEFEKIYKIQENKIKLKQFQRILFIFNYDRSHFLIFVYQQQTLYLIDSINCDRLVLQDLIVKLLNKFNYKVNNFIRLPVSQQENYNDCGPYACFFAMQLLRKQHLIGEEQFKFLTVDQEQISRFRLHISRVLYQSSASAYPF